ncbi:cytochrome c [Dokdonia pacifica]|uniref:Quinol:cytochrome c oxidoreductase monoheme cytochrome subunit n=1 Tax=Dokdonia pacifica TaxID=1627892 RepID=A0A238VSX5_9FLAO|nr:cytochrome c [Dokdonia pacifica]GGG18377.1 cytochrome c [Dokdonia pacifica]SNR36903.1 quinol:cytochrome c oxidoreductase monoheme cytochrome subunit [Dokdonia pacifica]
MKNIFKIAIVLIAIISLGSCQEDNKPNYQYMPNMYESAGYETYGDYEVFETVTGGSSAMKPAEGSIARGWMPYEIENTNEGKEFAKANLKNKLPFTEETEAKGQELYDIYCGICHGKKGDGNGTLVEREKILGVPAYNDEGRAITEGSVYHVMYYGINTMGSYASQMTEEEMWMVDHYVMSLKDKLDKKEPRAYDVVEEEIHVEETHDNEGSHDTDEHTTIKEDHGTEH